MVPTTPGSSLAKGLREILKQSQGPIGTSVKVIERPGKTIHSGLAPNNPFPRQRCHRTDCPYLVSGELCKERCLSVGLTYKGTCTICEYQQEDDRIPEEQRIQELYIGESSRTLYARTQEHIRDYKKAARDRIIPDPLDPDKKSSWMWDHMVQKHGSPRDIDPLKDFRFEKVSSHRDPLNRQIEEAIRINQALEQKTLLARSGYIQKVNSLNRKEEHFAPRKRNSYQ